MLGFTLQASWAQEARADGPEPLKVVFVNVAKKGGSRAAKKLRSILKKSGDVEVVDDSKFWEEAKKLKVTEKTLRSSKLRDKRRKRLRKLIRRSDIEAILVQDVYSRGKKLQLVVIGPRGEEIADEKRKIRRGRVKTKTAVSILKAGLKPLIPVVLEWRENRDDEEEDEEDEEDEGEDGGEDEEEKKDDEDADEDEDEDEDSGGSTGLVKRGVDIGLGALFGRRALNATTDNDFNLDHVTPFVGFALETSAIMKTLMKDSAGIGLRLGGGFAPFTTVFAAPNGEQQDLRSTFLRLGGDLFFLKKFSAAFSFDIYAGAELLAVTVAPNSYYTGNQYINGRAGLGFGYQFIEKAGIHLGGGILPMFKADTSSNAYGPGAFALGYQGEARLSVGLLGSTLGLEFLYNFTFLPPEYPNPTLLADPVTSTDVLHTGSLLIGLDF